AAAAHPGLVRPARTVRDGPVLRPGAGDRPVPDRHPGHRRDRGGGGGGTAAGRGGQRVAAGQGHQADRVPDRARRGLACPARLPRRVAAPPRTHRPPTLPLPPPRMAAPVCSRAVSCLHSASCPMEALPRVKALIPPCFVGDYRTPDRLRLGPFPIPTRYTDVWDALAATRRILTNRDFEDFSAEPA